MKSLKEKFGKFEMSKEQVKAVKGGWWFQTIPGDNDSSGGGNNGSGGHCPPNISEAWCHNSWTYGCGDAVCLDPDGYNACIATCISCHKC